MSLTAFFDLNGTLVSPIFVNSPEELNIIPGVPQSVAALSRRGFRCPVVTVQSRIGKGLFSEAQFRDWFRRFAELMHKDGAHLEGPYLCPHRYRDPCPCKKPQPFLYERAALELGLSLRGAFVIGDSPDDMEAARRIGGVGCLVRSPGTEDTVPLADYVGTNMAEIVGWILSQAAA